MFKFNLNSNMNMNKEKNTVKQENTNTEDSKSPTGSHEEEDTKPVIEIEHSDRLAEIKILSYGSQKEGYITPKSIHNLHLLFDQNAQHSNGLNKINQSM
jgi:hypothetical protein